MKRISIILSMLLFTTLFLAGTTRAQEEWPKTITAQNGSVIKVYEPQPESFTGNILKTRSAVSLMEPGQDDRFFGTLWAVSTVETDRDNRQVNIVSTKIPNLKFASQVDADQIGYLKTTLESELPKLDISFHLDQLLASLDISTEEKKLSKDLNNAPPKILYSSRPSILVTIDGNPKLQPNNDWGVDAVINSPFTIVKNTDGNFYLYGGKHWYIAPSATGPYTYVSSTPPNLAKVQAAVDNANNADPGFSSNNDAANAGTVSDIIVSTQPAELIQANGEPQLSAIAGTDLSYVSNSQNDIFFDQSSRQYYVLISGRWYKSAGLNGPWQYTAANALPGDFAKIPEGSPKDNVLASVAGTNAAREAVMDAQIPQTAKVDRKTATADITYDGSPRFDNIPGTHLQYGVNTQNSVIRYNGKYYAVENGVWFESGAPTGPWAVCTDRPDEVDIIPPSSPVYNMKYVYIYDVDPDYVYMGYTPGYLNTYIYGPTVVYGTGFYYTPWFGSYYYPRPYTWGFNMNYNPWYGWSLGYNYGFGWFNAGFGVHSWGGWRGGWWGPSIYRPPFYRGFATTRSGYYGRVNGGGFVSRGNVRVNGSGNIYNARRGVITNNTGSFQGRNGVNNSNRFPNRNGNNGAPTRMNGTTTNGSSSTGRINPAQERNTNRVTTDREGNVYQRNQGSNGAQWQQREQRQWKPVDNTRGNVIQNLNRQEQMHDRGEMRTQNFQRSAPASRPSAPASRPSSGGGRPSGGSGGRSGRH